MTFAVIPWLSISINLLLVMFVLVCLLMTLIILMQRPKQDGLGAAFGGGVTDQVFGARTTNVLQRGTVYLGSAFFILSLILAVLIGAQNRTHSTVDKMHPTPKAAPAAPAVPIEQPAPKSLSEELPPEAPEPIETPSPAEVPADGTVPTPPVESVPTETPAVEPTAPDSAPDHTPAPTTPEDKPAGQ